MQKHRCVLIMMILCLPLSWGFATPTVTAPATPKNASDIILNSGSNTTKVPKKEISTSQQTNQQRSSKYQQDISNYQQAIRDIESHEGVYGRTLTEKLATLGTALQNAGEHKKAIEVFKRAIHLNRINEGLYTTEQIPILERLIASHITLGEWDQVSDRYGYLYWLHTQNYGKDDPRILPALNQLSKWHLQAYAMQFGRDRDSVTDHLITAHSFIEKSIELLEKSETNQQQLIEELNDLTLTNYLFATYQRSALEKMASSVSSADMARMGFTADPLKRQSVSQIEQYINRSFRAGRDAIGRVIDIYANSSDAPPWSVPTTKVKLADWLFMFNKKEAAFELYQEAYALLSEQEVNKKALKDTFDRPVALPNLTLLETNNYGQIEQAQYDAQKHYVLVAFDVTPQGNAANIEVIDSQPLDDVASRSQVKRSIRIAKFRPRFVAGEPVLTEKMQLKVLSN